MIKVMKVNKKHIKIAALCLAGVIFLFLILFGGYSAVFAKKTFHNQYLGEDNLSGKNKNQLKELFENKIKQFLDAEIVLEYSPDESEKKTYQFKPSEIGAQYDVDGSIQEIWGYGRGGGIGRSLLEQLLSIFVKNRHQLVYTINEESLNKKISDIATELDIPEKDLELLYRDGKFVLSEEKQEGKRIDQDAIKLNVKKNISILKSDHISFKNQIYKPQINPEKANKKLILANKILEAGELALISDGQNFSADNDTIASFIKSRPKGDDLEIYYNEERLKVYVANLAKNIDVVPQNAQLTIANGRATVFLTARIGKTLDQTATVVDIENALTARMSDHETGANPNTVNLKVAKVNPEITDDSINTLGIVELVGTGTTDFRKSPSNRVHNIKIGAAALNGSLIKPGDTFSTLGHLGEIDASTGYLEELVIKENRTVPEFGGGLCQVSSTLFRSALNAGLKITERQSHKYRVSYYEPPIGMDATIYDPAPDLKFENNYASHLLIQSRIEGTKITFDIYGTKDSRVIEISTPEMYDIVEPGPPVMIETDTLAPGEKKILEKAHQGASAKFNYKVTRGAETLQSTTFVSKYIAWSEKWLVGKGATPDLAPVEQPTEPVPTPTPTPTPIPEPAPVVQPINTNTNS